MYFSNLKEAEKKIAGKVKDHERITIEEGLWLYEKAELGFLGTLANFIREEKNGQNTYYNRNYHFEPTNICIYRCKFCSYSRKFNETGSWEHTIEDAIAKARQYEGKPVTEVHIVGGVHPNRDLQYYGEMISSIKNILPGIHVKAFTAVELEFMIRKSGMNISDGLQKLQEYGLDSIPGGGAEIFDEEIRKQVCHQKSLSSQWLEIHEAAHLLGLPSNATMLYGHIEKYHHRIDHLNRLRELQDRTGGFQAFIPLKYRKKNNSLSDIGEVPLVEDLKNYAVSRIFLDNFQHIKAYWPMIGKETTQLSLAFGVDDMDGTIDDSTKIYSMAGAENSHPSMNTEEMKSVITEARRVPVERDSLYQII